VFGTNLTSSTNRTNGREKKNVEENMPEFTRALGIGSQLNDNLSSTVTWNIPQNPQYSGS